MTDSLNIKTPGLYLSQNGLYLMNEERIYFAKENKSHLLEDISLPKWLDILSENSQFSIKNKLVEIKELTSYHRKITYQLMEGLSLNDQLNLMTEYEVKFGDMLLTENVELLEEGIKDAWNWTKEKVVGRVKKFGSFAVKTAKDFSDCKSGKGCAPLFEDFREMLYSPVGIAVDVFLSATGVGKPALILVWGIMLIWDIYLKASGKPEFSWLNVIFDMVGMISGIFAKGTRAAAWASGLFQKTMGKDIKVVVQEGMKNPETAKQFSQIGNLIRNGASKITGILGQSAAFLSEKLGMKWAGGMVNKVSEFIAKILEAFGIKAKLPGVTTAQGVKSGIKGGAVTAGLTAGLESQPGQQVISKVANIGRKGSDEDLINILNASGTAQYTLGVDY